MSLWLPPSREHRPVVSREHAERTVEHRAVSLSMLYTDDVCRAWDRDLRLIDSRLHLMRAKDNAHALNVRPGFYHLVRLNEGAPITVEPLAHPITGGFVEPGSQLLDALRACDLQNHAVVRDRLRHDELAAKRKEREDANASEDRVSEGVERWKAGTRTQVLMSPDIGWAQNFAGTKRPTRGKGSR